jgi:hypothetical protein
VTTEIVHETSFAAAERFVRSHWSGGIGDPDTTLPDITSVVEEIKRAASAGSPWQPCATLHWEAPQYVYWVSGSEKGALVWLPEGCIGIDADTTQDLALWADLGVITLLHPGFHAERLVAPLVALILEQRGTIVSLSYIYRRKASLPIPAATEWEPDAL